jgi:hypothetical protein
MTFDPRISAAPPDFPVCWLYRRSLPYDLVWTPVETFPTLNHPTFSTCGYPCVRSPSSLVFTRGLRAQLPRFSAPGLTAEHMSTLRYSLHAASCRAVRLSPRSRQYYDTRGIYIRAFLTLGHPKVKSDITTQPTGLLLWWNFHPLVECFYGLHRPPVVKLLFRFRDPRDCLLC